MKRIATVVVMLHLGVAAVYARGKPVKMTFSGTSAPSTINLQQPDTSNDEDNFAGKGTLGSFTLRNVRAIANSPTPSSTCSGPTQLYFTEPAGGGVFRFQDGSLLNVNLTQGGDCVDFAAREAHCAVTFSNRGGNRPFQECVRYPYVYRDRGPSVGRRLEESRLLCRYRGVYGNGFRSGYRGGRARRAAVEIEAKRPGWQTLLTDPTPKQG